VQNGVALRLVQALEQAFGGGGSHLSEDRAAPGPL
jgi:hypothetical protein